MKKANEKERITRRGIFELSSAALATAGVLAGVNTAKGAQDAGKKVDSTPWALQEFPDHGIEEAADPQSTGTTS